MIFLDAGYLIARFRTRDEHHLRAMEISEKLRETGETIITSEGVLSEFVTFMRRNDGVNVACQYGEQLRNASELSIAYSTQSEGSRALAHLRKYEFSSYTDGLSVAMMESRGLKRIVSFDSEFDRVPFIQRIR